MSSIHIKEESEEEHDHIEKSLREEEQKKQLVKDCRKCLCAIVDQYVSACIPSVETMELKPTQLQELEIINAADLDHASLQLFSYNSDDVEIQNLAELQDLRQMLASVQLHSHTFTCFKNSDLCRFHFYKKLRPFSEFKFVKFSKNKSAMLKFLPKRNNKKVNDYSVMMIIHQRSNLDLQFICNPHGTAVYSCWYSSKAEAPDRNLLSRKILNFLGNERNTPEFTRKKLFLAANAVYYSREVSFQEIAWYLLGYPFVFRSKSIVEINLLPPSKRSQRIKNKESLARMESTSRDIFINPVIVAPEVKIFMSLNKSFNQHHSTDVCNEDENDDTTSAPLLSSSVQLFFQTGDVNANTEGALSKKTFNLVNKYYANVKDFSLYHFLSR